MKNENLTGLIHHIEIYVSDIEKSKKFWEWFLIQLGYKIYQNWNEGFSLRLYNTYIVFVQTQKKYLNIPYHRCGIGLNHLAFYAESREQVDCITKKLKDLDVNILYSDKHPFAGGEDHYAVYFEDPDRIKVELAAP